MTKKGYARISKSREDQTSIAQQISRIKARGVEERDIYVDDGKSAGLDNDNPKDVKMFIKDHWFWVGYNLKKRPSFEKLLLEAQKEPFELYFDHWSRFSRNASFQDSTHSFLKNLNVKLKPTDDTEDPFGRKITGMVNEKYIDDLRERINASKTLKFGYGLYTGANLKKGYKWVKINIHGTNFKNLELDPKKTNEINLVRTIKKSNYSLELCKRLKINPQTFYNIKRDPFYEGFVTLKGEKKKGIHKPIL